MERLEVTFSKAVIRLTLEHPFLAQLYYGVPNTVVDDDSLTACTTGSQRYYGRKFMSELSVAEQQFLVAHEILHDMLEHPFRRGNRRADVWGHAIDYKVNQLLDESGLQMPTGKHAGLRDKQYDALSEEQIYDKLLEGSPPNNSESGGGESGDGEAGDGPQVSGRADPSKGRMDDHADAQGTPEEVKQARQEAQARVLQAAATAKQFGNLPVYAQGIIDQILCPKEKWYEYLRRFFVSRSWDDYTHDIINRRELFRTGVVAPSLYSETLGHVVIGVDESGSIHDGMLSAFAAHVSDILQDTKPEKMTVLYFDTEVADEREEYTVNDLPITLRRVAGGGTSFVDVCRQAEELRADVLLVLTDMAGEFPRECSVPTIWCSTEAAETTVPFGEVIHVSCE